MVQGQALPVMMPSVEGLEVLVVSLVGVELSVVSVVDVVVSTLVVVDVASWMLCDAALLGTGSSWWLASVARGAASREHVGGEQGRSSLGSFEAPAVSSAVASKAVSGEEPDPHGHNSSKTWGAVTARTGRSDTITVSASNPRVMRRKTSLQTFRVGLGSTLPTTL
jgi:hypothetical protein